MHRNSHWLGLFSALLAWNAYGFDPLLATKEARLLADDRARFDNFGESVAISGDTALIGACGVGFDPSDNPFERVNTGAVYVYVRSGTTWTQQAKFTSSDIAENDTFGCHVALDGDTALIGAGADDLTTPDRSNAGSAYVFTRSAGVWTQQQKLVASDGAANDFFGSSVALSGDTAVVGAAFDDTPAGNDAGSAYVFTRSAGVWTQQQKLIASDAAPDDVFGISVALSGDVVMVGAPTDFFFTTGAVYVFTRSGSTWTEQQKLSSGESIDNFGASVALAGDTALVGAPADSFDLKAITTGAAHVYRLSGGVWTQETKLTPIVGRPFYKFGENVALDGDTAMVGGRSTDSVDVFTRNASIWVQQHHLTPDSSADFGDFGAALAIAGDSILIGAPVFEGEGISGIEQAGAAYVYRLGSSTSPPAFHCYPARNAPKQLKFLPSLDRRVVDLINNKQLDLKSPTRLCAATGLNGMLPGDPGIYLACYATKVNKFDVNTDKKYLATQLNLSGMLGAATHTVKTGTELCIPADLTDDALPAAASQQAYACYPSKPSLKPLPQSFDVNNNLDPRGAVNTTLSAPSRVCLPVSLDDSPVNGQGLTCYKARADKGELRLKPFNRQLTGSHNVDNAPITRTLRTPDLTCLPHELAGE